MGTGLTYFGASFLSIAWDIFVGGHVSLLVVLA